MSGRLAGSVRWAVVPFTPRPPFRIYAGAERGPIEVSDLERLVGAARRGADAELTYLVPAKVRPVLVLNEPPAAHHADATALRLVRLSTLTEEQRDVVRRQQDELLFYLDPARVDLPEENAAIVSTLVRVHVDAVAGDSLGRLDDAELRLLGERIIRWYGFDTRRLVERQIRELVARRRHPE